MAKNISFSKFYNEILCNPENNKQFALLAGNGLGLSNPNIEHLFRFNPSKIKRKLRDDFNDYYLLQNFFSSEGMLGYFRHEIILLNSNYYIENIESNYDLVKSECKRLNNFISLFKSIYTINYDPIIYQALLDKYKNEFFDGFIPNGKDWLEQDKVVEDIKSFKKNGARRGLFYLHGAFYLFRDLNCDKIKKISISPVCNIKTEYERIKKQIREGAEHLIQHPLIVMADKSIFKEAIIQNNNYLRCCHELLEKEGNVFVFGCSFERDDHLLKILLDEKNKKELYFAYVTSYNEIESKLKNFDNFDECKIHFVRCGDDQEKVVRKRIWDIKEE